MEILGLDVGYSDTKDHKYNIFRTAFSLYDQSVFTPTKLTIDGKDYYPGTGRMTSEVDKTNTEMNKVCTIYNLILNNIREVYLVVGLPIGQYQEQKDKLRDNILAYNKCKVMHNDKPYEFKIRDVIVTRQGVSSLYTMKELYGEYIVIDIGGLTVDVSLAEFGVNNAQLIKYDTWFLGIRTLYSSIISAVNNHFCLNLEVQYAEKILRRGLSIYGKPQDLSFLKPLLLDYIDTLAEEIRLKYPVDTVPIYLTGGGAELLYNPFCKRFADVHKIDNPQFANALGYYIQGYFKYTQRSGVIG